MIPRPPLSPATTEAPRGRQPRVEPANKAQPLQQKALELLQTNLKKRPVATLAVAAAIGLLVGRLVKR